MAARILLLYITPNSGHFRAAQAIARALAQRDPSVAVEAVDAFQYFNPLLARIVNRTYMSVIRRAPEIWEYLYDNPKIARRAAAFRDLLHHHDSPKLEALLTEFRPTAVACTQAFPCGITADYKKTRDISLPLYAILTDFIPHRYWVHESVDGYLVGSEAAQARLETAGIPRAKIRLTGIPIDPVFSGPHDGAARAAALGLDPTTPIVLLMGGGQGLGPLAQVAQALEALPHPMQLVVLTGTNARLKRRLTDLIPAFRRRLVVLGHVPYVHELMALATLIVTKPGGLTAAEALAMQLPIVIVDPIPGQEAKNTEFLLERQAAVHAARWEAVPAVVEELLGEPARLTRLRQAAGALGHPRAALDIAGILLAHK